MRKEAIPGIHLFLNNYISKEEDYIEIIDVKYLSSKDEFKVRIFDPFWYRQTLYLSRKSVKKASKLVNNGIRKWLP